MIVEETSFETMVRRIREVRLREVIARKGELIVIVGASPLVKAGTTNMVRVETVGQGPAQGLHTQAPDVLLSPRAGMLRPGRR